MSLSKQRNIALTLAYDGTNYHGWQMQKNAVTIQETLTKAAASLFNEDVKVIGCGRTDSGVHAKKYIASVRTSSEIKTERIAYALNSLLPSDISIYDALETLPDFHPVHSCLKKEYTYFIHTSKTRDPFLQNKALHYRFPIDFEKIRRAAAHFEGTHDFASMQSVGTVLSSTVRTVYDCEVSENNNILAIRISANGFLYNMARAIVGTLLDVNAGKILPDDIPGILLSCDRSKAGFTSPAHGLYMTEISYPEKYGL